MASNEGGYDWRIRRKLAAEISMQCRYFIDSSVKMANEKLYGCRPSLASMAMH